MSTAVLCNQAGHHLASMHEWEWLARSAYALPLVANQTTAKLPADFGRVIGLNGATTGGIQMTSLADIAQMRSSSTSYQGASAYYAAVSYKPGLLTGQIQPVLEIYPTPTTTDSTSYKLYYRAAWPTVSLATDLLPLPQSGFMDALYMQIVLAFAQGLEEADVDSLHARLAEIQLGPVYSSAVLADGGVVGNLGQMRGAISNRGYPDWGVYPYGIGAPGSSY